MPCRILSIDGGGLRGIIPVLLLKYIEGKVQKQTESNRKLVNYFQLVAGTSTGGLIACGATVGAGTDSESTLYDWDYIERVYRDRGKEIFPFKGMVGEWWRTRFPLSYPSRPQFNSQGLERVLNDLFPEKHISDCVVPILITSYNVSINQPFYLGTRKVWLKKKEKQKEETVEAAAAFERYDYRPAPYYTENLPLADVCLATAAGPTYLPGKFLWRPERGWYVDGGVFQNNPATPALVDVLKYPQAYTQQDVPPALDDIYILSIGTGRYNEFIKGEKAHQGGRLDWIKPMIDISMWGNSQAVDEHMKRLFAMRDGKIRYLRLNVNITDKRFADMAISTDDAMNHYESRVNDFLSVEKNERDIDNWLRDSGIIY